jgi:Ca2+-binding EF-hand superfamily protein
MTDLTALTSLQDLKLNRAFAHLDVDGDGQVEREDVLALGARLLIGFGEAPTSTKGRDLLATLEGMWDSLLDELDVGREGRLTTDDFRDGMAGAFVHGGDYAPVLGAALDAIARLCDTDDDGRIGLDELRTLHDAFGLDEGAAIVAMARLDLDGSGRITTAELAEAAREFYTSDDPEALGNWLFGSLERPGSNPFDDIEGIDDIELVDDETEGGSRESISRSRL